MKNLLSFLILALILVTASPSEAKLNVVATLPDYGAIAEAIGGSNVKVTTLARGTEDPHFVDARPSFIRVLNQADVLIEGGAELEIGWLPPLVNSARNAKILSDAPGHVVLSHGIQLLDVPNGPLDRSQGDVHPAGNPHFNLDPALGKPIASSIAAAFIKLDSANAASYEANLKKFNERLEAKLAEWTRIMAPFRGAKVITYHKSFDYLLERFGLELAGTIEPRPGIEPSPTHINALIPRAKAAGVKLVIIEPNRPRKTPTYVAESAGAKLVVLPALVNGVPQASSFLDLIDYNVRTLAAALQ